MIKKFTLITLILLSFIFVKAQDTIVTTDHTTLIGKIKSMDRGVLIIKTDFSDDDFKVKWLKVEKIVSDHSFRVIIKGEKRYYGPIQFSEGNLIINDEEVGAVSVVPEDIVYIKQVNKGSVLDLINLSLDVGYSFTNANNLEQINGSLTADYTTNVLGANIYATTVRSKQTNVDAVIRNTGGLGFKVFLERGLFASTGVDLYSNTEQSMKLRSNYNLSIGNYFFRTNRQYFSATLGAAFLNEDYSDTLPDRQSYEGRISLEYNMFDMGDLSVLTSINLFPSFTEKGRLRTEYKLDVKLALPRDFYIKGSLNYNYDNMPAAGVTFDDYVYTFGLGWEL